MQLQINYVDLILIYVIFAVSLNLLMGFTGQVSVAHGAFGAIGGYTLAYVFLNHHWQTFAGMGLGVVFAAIAGIVVGIPALRLTTEWLILLTLAFQIIVVSLVQTLTQLGGTYGLQNVTPLNVFGHKLLQPTDLLPLFAVLAAIVIFICWRMGESPYGRVLRGIREDELACRSLGKNVFAYKLTVFGVTCAMAGLAGALLVITNEIASPALFSFDLSTTIVAMVIFGGMGNLVGSILGATILVLLGPFFENVLSFNAQKAALWRLVAYGLVLVVVMLVRPQGILPEGAAPIRWVRARMAERRHEKLSPELELAELRGGALVDVAPLVDEETAPPPVPHVGALVDAPLHDDTLLEDAEERETPASTEPVVQVYGLTKRFGGITAAYDLSMQLNKGTITALVGPNGAGKTTVYNLLTGAIRPDSGKVLLKGEDITAMRPDQVALRGMVRSFQDVRVFNRLSVLQNVMLAVPDQPGERVLQLFGRWVHSTRVERQVRERAMQWLDFVGMSALAPFPAGALAFGQQKLVALARVLATESDVVLLDEPSSGIDEQWVDVMLGLIEKLRPQGRTVCIVEHNLHVVGRLADHVYFMELGRITAEGSFEDLTSEQRLAEAYFGTA